MTEHSCPRPRLSLMLVERSTRSECKAIEIEVLDAAAFSLALGIDPKFSPTNGLVELDADEVAWCNATYGLSIDTEKFYVFLDAPQDDDLPYTVHTRRELRLMLDGVKPMAVFSDFHPLPNDPWVFPEDVFASHVLNGTFVQREYCELIGRVPNKSIKGTRVLIYARPVEAWRIDAYITMRFAAAATGWNEGFERMEGALLGYEEWQTDDHLRRNGAWWARLRGSEAKGEAD